MARDILSDYGPESSSGSRATIGGKCDPKPIDYSPPKGPSGQMQQGPGIHGTNHGPNGTQGKH